jgi:hypothetical protein
MSEEAIYDEAYYQGIKDVVQIFLLMHMDGATLVEIRERIVNMRGNAKIDYEDSIERAGYDQD